MPDHTPGAALKRLIDEISDEELRHIVESKDIGSCRSRILSALSKARSAGQTEEYEPVGYQYRHRAMYPGDGYVWTSTEYYNGTRSEVSREIFALKHSPKAGQESPLQEARRELDAENASFAEFEARAKAGQEGGK